MISFICEIACDASNVCDEDPGFRAGDGFLPIFREAPTSVQPGKLRSTTHPPGSTSKPSVVSERLMI